MRNKLISMLSAILLVIGIAGTQYNAVAQTVNFSFYGKCVGSPTDFAGSVTGITAGTWSWDYGDGTFDNGQVVTHTFPAVNSPGGYPVTLTVTDIVSGLSYSVTKFVVIQDLPFVFFSFNTPTCSSDSVRFHNLSNTTNGWMLQYTWDFGDGSPQQVINFPDNPDVAHKYTTFGTYNVTLEVMNSDSCVNQISIPVAVIPGPTANFFFNGKCEDQVVHFTDASFAGGAGNIEYWGWNFDDPISGINDTSTLPNPDHLFQLPGTYNVVLKVTNFNGCSDTIIKKVVINPHPPVEFTFNETCLNELITFTVDPVITNLPAIQTFQWDFGDGFTFFGQNATHAYTSPGTYVVTLTVTDTLGCMNTVQHTIIIHDLPVANFDAGVNNCVGATVQFTNTSTTSAGAGYIVRWEWDFGDGNTMVVKHPGNPNVQHTYTNSGPFLVTLFVKASDSCDNFIQKTIIISPNPLANFDFTQPACFGSPVNFTDLTQTNGGGSIVQRSWDFGDPASGTNNFSILTNPSHTFTAPATYQVRLITSNADGCSDTITIPVTVDPKPAVDFTWTYNCQNKDVEFQPNASIMNIPGIGSWLWDFGDGITTTTQAPNHTYNVAGTYTVRLTVIDINGCTNFLEKSITILEQPIPGFTFTQPACRQSAIVFSSTSTSPVGYIVRWEWNFGDGNSQVVRFPASTDVTHIFNNFGTFMVQLRVITSDSCDKSITIPVDVSPNPLSNFSYLTTCAGTPVQFNSLAQPGAGGITAWLWNFGDPGSGTNNTSMIEDPTHTFTAPATYPVSLIVTNTGGCQDTLVKSVVVHPLPVVDFSVVSGCVDDSTQFISSTFVNPTAVVNRVWDFGDGMTATNVDDPYHTYTSSGVFTVTLTVTDTAGCENRKERVISVAPPPISLFQYANQTCANNPVFFTNQSSTPGGTIISYFWEFGDGNDTLLLAPTTGNISHIYAVAGNYTIKLTINTSLGCEAFSTRPITISASPLALFNYDITCAGEAVSFTDLSQVNTGTAITTWLWNFGDPTSGTNNTSNLQNPLHIFNTAGPYTVLLQVGNASGCPDTLSKVINVHPQPPVDFSWSNTCIGTATQFTTNTTVTNIGAVASFDWDFGDGSPHNTSQQNPVHTYLNPGNYTAILLITDTSGCKNSVPHIISISPQPTAQFSVASACLGAKTFFNDQSFVSSGEPIIGWHWDFGVASATNDTSNLQNPSWTYTALGVYSVNLTVTSLSGCKDSVTMSVQVFGTPTANFTYTATPCDNAAVYFQDSSYNQQATIVGWNWEFEPNHYSTLQNPVYVFYAADSCYDVRLIATDSRGCVDTITKKACVPAKFVFTFTASTTCFRDSTYFTPQVLSPANDSLVFFKWNFGEPSSGIYNTSTLRYPSHLYSSPGEYTVVLEAIDIFNCTDEVYIKIKVLPIPIPVFSYTAGLCDSTINFNDASSGNGKPIKYWIWQYGDGSPNDTIRPPLNPDVSHLYTNAGIYVVGLIVTNTNDCSNTIVDSNVLVKPCMNAEFEIIDTLICQNNMLSFADSSYSGLPTSEWYWDFGDGTDTTYYKYTNPVNHTFTSPGIFNVKMRISTDVSGKTVSDSAIVIVQVNATPLPEFSHGVVCYMSNAVFTNLTSGNGTKISGYKWNFGEPSSAPNDTSTLKNPSHLYKAPGTYEVKLVTKNTIGCTDSIQKSLIVFGLPDANYSYSLSCAGDKTSFKDLSVEAVAPLERWQWTYTKTNEIIGRSEEQNPDFIFKTPGNYLVNLLVADTNGCVDTINQNVTTWNIPTSVFTYDENFNDVQGQLQFENSSIDATKYYWSFGNGEFSYAENPAVFYQNDGTYLITLITWNDKNCSDTLISDYKFMVKGLYIPNAFSPTNPKKEVQLLKPVGINLKEFRLDVYDRWGNFIWYTDKLDASGRPTEGWNGELNGEVMPEGVYLWRASGVFKDGTIWEAENVGNNDNLPKTKTGTATLIR